MTYRWQTEPCACGDGSIEKTCAHGFYAIPCEQCEGRGVVDASCVDCREIVPLNDEGSCEKCWDSGTLTTAAFDAKYALVPVEHRDLGDGRHRVAA